MSAAAWACATARVTDRPLAAADYVPPSARRWHGFDGRLLLEPGRYLVAEAGVLLTRVIRVKPGVAAVSSWCVDAAMNDLPRPSLYDAWHDIVPVAANPTRDSVRYDVVGPVCESGDTFARDRAAARMRGRRPADDPGHRRVRRLDGIHLQLPPAGGRSAARPGRYAIVRRRQLFGEMMAGEQPARHWQTA